MTPPFGLADAQVFEERSGRAERFLDLSLEFFRLPAQPLELREHVLVLISGARRFLRWSRHGRDGDLPYAATVRFQLAGPRI
jgi:hypothetical protein